MNGLGVYDAGSPWKSKLAPSFGIKHKSKYQRCLSPHACEKLVAINERVGES